MSQLPLELQDKVNRYVRWQDRYACLLGKLLLLEGIKQFGLKHKLGDLKYNHYSRPYFEGKFDFNISHSGEFVTCACSDSGKIGIDIEKVHSIKMTKFQRFFSTQQWNSIDNGECAIEEFFLLWTKLESVIKYEGSGIYNEIKEIELLNGSAKIKGHPCLLNEVKIQKGYVCHIATEYEDNQLLIKEVKL